MYAGRKKRGRKARYAIYNGQEVEGLYYTLNKDGSIRNFYYLDENKRQVSCTADVVEAVRRFRQYQSKNTTVELRGIPRSIGYDVDENSIAPDADIELLIDENGIIKQDLNTYHVQAIVDKFVELLKADPFRIAEMAGIPQFAHIEDITPRPKSLTLKELIDDFKIRTDISHNYLKDVKIYWNEFSNIVQKIEIRRITFEDIKKYNDVIHDQSKAIIIKNKQRYIKNRFDAIKAVILYCKSRNEYKKDFIILLGHLEQLKYITKFKTAKPKVLTRDEFQAMFKKADKPLSKCLLLLGLNCGMRYTDIIHLKKSEIDFKDKYLQRQRTKTGIIHSAILWDFTIQALHIYIKDNPNNSEYVFATKFNNQYVEKYLRTLYFNRIRTNNKITHKHLRNSLSSIANRFHCNPNGIKITMGHNISGVDNSYNERHPEATREVCKAVYKYYFGGQIKPI